MRAFRTLQTGMLMAFLALSACIPTPQDGPEPSGKKPHSRPDQRVAQVSPAQRTPSNASRALAVYYQRVQDDLLTQGLLRRDGGGPDTPYDADLLATNFERIALADEYVRGEGFRAAAETAGPVKKWQGPVRITANFGASVPPEQRAKDLEALTHYVARLRDITGHDITMTTTDANFVVIFAGEDDNAMIKPRVTALVPNVNRASLRIFDTMPRSIHCLVIAFSKHPGGYNFGNAVAYIRAEHPDLLRLSCIHEEVAQGLGLGNDSPRARPSIFNDDDEFALLTTHDEMLLKILYNPRLTAGMSADSVRPVVHGIASRLLGGPS